MYAIDYLSSRTTTQQPSAPTLVEITPVEARRLLENSASFKNRQVKRSVVSEYAESIKNGEWNYAVGDPIRIDTHGRVIDGQHRLLAVVQSDTPQHFYLISNLPPESVNFIDIGQPRSHADFVAMTGAADSKRVAAGVRWVSHYQGDRTWYARSGLPRHKIAQWIQDHPEILRSAVVSQQVKDVLRRMGVATGTHYIFSLIDKAEADSFFEKLRTGLNVEEGDPVYRLRERLIDPWRKLGEYETSAFVIKAWNLTRSGTKIKRLLWAPGQGEEFPTAI